jgi:proline iminopeptidase
MTLLWLFVLLALDQPASASNGPAREGFVTTDDGVRLRYRELGDRGPAIVIPVSVLTAPHFDRLASNARVIYYDPRGRGGSDTGSLKSLSLDRNIQDLEALRRHLGLEKMALIGLSGYGMELAAYALEHPSRVSHLVQLAPVPPRQHPHMDGRWERVLERVDKSALERVRELEKSDPAAACRAEQRALAPGFSAAPDRIDVDAICRFPNEYSAHQAKVWEAFAPSIDRLDLRSRVGELRMPRLLVYGERDLIPLEGVREWLADGAPARLMTVADADHLPHIDRPDIVLPAVEAFLRQAP